MTYQVRTKCGVSCTCTYYSVVSRVVTTTGRSLLDPGTHHQTVYLLLGGKPVTTGETVVCWSCKALVREGSSGVQTTWGFSFVVLFDKHPYVAYDDACMSDDRTFSCLALVSSCRFSQSLRNISLISAGRASSSLTMASVHRSLSFLDSIIVQTQRFEMK